MVADPEIAALESEWQRKLRGCEYAGEVYLGQDTLLRLSRQYGRQMSTAGHISTTVLLVLAVNCAYHFYDDQGFWLHFFDLLDIENKLTNRQRIGEALERRIELLGLKRINRTGPFRYVGAILEQSGVSKRYIESFANMVRELKRSYLSLDALITAGPEKFRQRLDAFSCSSYLKAFVMDAAGWKFTLQVCETLLLYEHGALLISDLRQLPGYQPGFWDEMVHHLDLTAKTRIYAQYVARPRLIFLPEERCIAIRFPRRDYPDGVSHPAVRGLWRFPLTLLQRSDAWAEHYAGVVADPEGRQGEWVIQGWLPDGLPVLFDPGSGLVRRSSTVMPGEYYLLVPGGYSVSCRVVSELGPVPVPGNKAYRAFLIAADHQTRIEGYECLQDHSTDIVLSWVEPERFRPWYSEEGSDVFSGSLPALAVSDFSAIEDQRFAMFYAAGPVSGRIRNREDLERAFKEIYRTAPVAGRFTVLPVGRSGRTALASAPAELEFYLMPSSGLRFSRRLYAFDEEAVVELDPAFRGRLSLPGCSCQDEDGKLWKVPVTVSRATGTVDCGDLAVGVSIPVWRARLYLSDGKPLRYLDVTDLDKEEPFLLAGPPDSEGTLQLYGRTDRSIPVTFDDRGTARITPRQLREIVEDHGACVTEVVLAVDEHSASTGTVIFDRDILFSGIFSGDGYCASMCSSRNLTPVLDLCAQICLGVPAGRIYNLKHIVSFHPLLDESISSTFACASVFDDVEVKVAGRKYGWPEKLGREELRRVLEFVRTARSGESQHDPPPYGKDVLPPVGRWRDFLEELFFPYETDETISGLSEWAAEVVRRQTSFRSKLAGTKGGHALSGAWVRYYGGQFDSALVHLNRIGECSPILSGLRDFLYILLMLRLARIESVTEACQSEGQGGRRLREAVCLLRYIVRTLNGQENVPGQRFPTDAILLLPLRAEDRELLKIASASFGTHVGTLTGPAEGRDWLSSWFVINLCRDAQRKGELARDLLRFADSIPPSPDKEEIVNRLITYAEVD